MQVLIVGAGGHGKVVLDAMRAAGGFKPVGFIDADPALAGQRVGGIPVLGPTNLLPKLRQQKITAAFVAIGDHRSRRRYMELLREHGYRLVNVIHPSASVSDSAVLGDNVLVAAGAVVCTESRIADGVIINTAAVVDHECEVGETAHICPGARLAGRVRVGADAMIGLGANVIQCLTVGEGAVVGAGAVVLSDVPAHATAVGVPARVIKLSDSASADSVACAVS